MGLFEKLFPRKPPSGAVMSYFKTLTAYQPVFTTRSGGLYEMALTRSIISAFARHCSKLNLEIIGGARPDLANILAYQPNYMMSSAKFLARLATIFEIQNNAFIVPIEDKFGRLIGYYPIMQQQTELREYKGQLYLCYKFAGGQNAAVEFERVGTLVQHQYSDDFFGESNRPINTTLDVIQMQNEGMIHGIKNASSIRFIARLAKMINNDDLKKEQKRFADDNLSNNDTGIMMFDSKYADVKQVESTALVVNPRQQELIRQNAFEYFGSNDKILTNTYNEDEWNAYYEGKIEPFAIMLSEVLTQMTFTPSERAKGNKIIATSNRLQYASNQTKLNFTTQMFDRGFINHNQGLAVFNMSPVEGGDKLYIRKEYTEVSKLDKNKEAQNGN